jgi:hypothetical protein
MQGYSPEQLNAMTDDERKAALDGEFGQAFHISAHEHVVWIMWTRAIAEPTDIMGQGSGFILRRGETFFLVTAGHVYRRYLQHQREHGDLYCQVQNTTVTNLTDHLIACGDLDIPLDEPDREREADIAVFRVTPGAVSRIGKTPIEARLSDWPPPPNVGENVMFVGFPGRARDVVKPDEVIFGIYSGMTPVTSITEHQIACRFNREHWIDAHGAGLPPLGYGLGGISGGPLLVSDYQQGKWAWRLGGVISQAPAEREPEDVVFESVVAHRAEYILPDGTLAKVR